MEAVRVTVCALDDVVGAHGGVCRDGQERLQVGDVLHGARGIQDAGGGRERTTSSDSSMEHRTRTERKKHTVKKPESQAQAQAQAKAEVEAETVRETEAEAEAEAGGHTETDRDCSDTSTHLNLHDMVCVVAEGKRHGRHRGLAHRAPDRSSLTEGSHTWSHHRHDVRRGATTCACRSTTDHGSAYHCPTASTKTGV